MTSTARPDSPSRPGRPQVSEATSDEVKCSGAPGRTRTCATGSGGPFEHVQPVLSRSITCS